MFSFCSYLFHLPQTPRCARLMKYSLLAGNSLPHMDIPACGGNSLVYGKPIVAIFNTINSFNPILIFIQCNSPIHSIQYIYMNSIQFNPYIHSIQSSNSFNSIHIYEFSSIQSLNSFNPILKFIPFNTCI